ncbi:MAG TPA: permease-like cell division protein FtsX [Chitinophagaceae bacterium]|nr:permease-like cell division protein FtsX [Chitinophagaceae bacterium]
MSQSGKASIKRGKPSYFMSILGVTLVLFVLGIIGWLIINAGKLGQHFKENVEVSVDIRENLNPKDSVALLQYIASKPYVKEYQYINKEMARKLYIRDGNKSWDNILDYNPLPNSISFKLKKEYVNTDSLTNIKADLEKQTYVTEVRYQKELVDSLNKNIRKWSLILLAIAFILSVVVIILIDNTIRLAMFSNRFLIKTMQMVGATRWFIAKPMNIKAIINGAISGVIAVAAIWLFVIWAENYEPALKAIHDSGSLLFLFFGLIVIGVGITLFSTNRSVVKYLKMKLDDLY